jgi:undecaprenyl-diphosphatase
MGRADETPAEQTIGDRDLTQWRSRPGRALAGWVLGHVTGLSRWTAAHLVLVATAVLGGVVAVGLTAGAAEVYDAVTESDGVAGLDQPVLDRAVALRSPGLDAWVTRFTDLGGPVPMTVLATAATLLLALLWRSRTPVVLMAIAAAGSLAMTSTGKALIGRVRPPQVEAVPPFESSPSFPSGHTLNATVLTAVVVYLLLGRLSSAWGRTVVVVAGAAFVGAMGLSRVFLGHHWLTDVMAGWLLGLGWAAAVITAHRLYLTVRRARTGAWDAPERPPERPRGGERRPEVR